MGATVARFPLTRDARFRLKAVLEAAAQARAHVEITFARWGLHHLIADGELITSELISNSIAVTSDEDDVWLLLTQARNAVWICVWDPCPVLPEVRSCEPDAEHGRGLHIVAAVADRNGAFRVAERAGKITWRG